MKKSKIIQLLKLLSIEEHKQFRRFLNSPYHNLRDKFVLPLYEYFYKNAIQKKSVKLSFKNAFHEVYKEEDFDLRKIENKCSNLVVFLEEFLVINRFKKQDFEREFNLALVYKQKKAERFFLRKLAKCDQALEAQNERGAWYYANKLKVAHERYFYINAAHYSQEGDNYLRQLIKLLLMFFTFAAFRYSVEGKNRSKIRKVNFDIPLIEEIKKHYKNSEFQSEPLFDIYSDLIQLFNGIPTNFEALFTNFKEQLYFENKEGQATLSTAMINHAALKYNEGHKGYGRKTYEIYHVLLKLGALESEGLLDRSHFLNMGILIAQLDDEEETLRFIDEYLPHIPIDQRENCKKTIHAFLTFEQGKFSKAIEILHKTDYSDFSEKERVGILQIRCYYELIQEGKEYPLRGFCATFRKFLSRNNEIAEGKKVGYFNFITEVKKLESLLRKNKPSQNKIAYIMDMNPLYCKNWLIEKHHELTKQ